MKRIFVITLSAFLIVILLASCAMLEDPIVASLGDYETHVYFTSGGFQDFTDYAKYYYRSAEVTENLWLEKILQESAYMIYREDELDTAQAYAAATKEYSWDKYLQPVLETALFRYTYTLTPEEACELYSDCIVPDMYDGTIGRVWLITDDAYAAEVTKGEFRIELEREIAQAPLSGAEKAIAPYTKSEYAYDHFSIVLTVSAARTNAWMAARGLPLRSIAESFAG